MTRGAQRRVASFLEFARAHNIPKKARRGALAAGLAIWMGGVLAGGKHAMKTSEEARIPVQESLERFESCLEHKDIDQAICEGVLVLEYLDHADKISRKEVASTPAYAMFLREFQLLNNYQRLETAVSLQRVGEAVTELEHIVQKISAQKKTLRQYQRSRQHLLIAFAPLATELHALSEGKLEQRGVVILLAELLSELGYRG